MKKRKLKWKNIILTLVSITFIITLTISIINIIKWKMDSNKTNNEITNIQENAEIIEPVEEVPEENPYWD